MRRHATAALVLGLLAVAPPAPLHAQGVPTCVQVRAEGLPAAERRALRRLVESELRRHRTHEPVAEGCSSHLAVELIVLEGRRYLTGSTDFQVPYRVDVAEEGGLEPAVVELLRVVLHNDPVVLRGPEEEAGLGGALGRLRRGHSLWQVELRQGAMRVQGHLYALSGLAVGFRREVHRFALGARLLALLRPSEAPGRTAPVAYFAAELGGRWMVAPDADASLYLGGHLALVHHWLRGPLDSEPELIDTVNVTGLAAGLRAGLELLRTTAYRLDFYVDLTAPAFVTADETAEVVDEWLPTISAGAGLAI